MIFCDTLDAVAQTAILGLTPCLIAQHGAGAASQNEQRPVLRWARRRCAVAACRTALRSARDGRMYTSSLLRRAV